MLIKLTYTSASVALQLPASSHKQSVDESTRAIWLIIIRIRTSVCINMYCIYFWFYIHLIAMLFRFYRSLPLFNYLVLVARFIRFSLVQLMPTPRSMQ